MDKPTPHPDYRPPPQPVPAVCPHCYGNAGMHFLGCPKLVSPSKP